MLQGEKICLGFHVVIDWRKTKSCGVTDTVNNIFVPGFIRFPHFFERILKFYVAFQRIKNFACVEIRPQNKHILVYVKIDPESITLEPGFTRDVRGIGHFGTGDLEITLRSDDDLGRAKDLILKSYEAN